MKIKELKKLVSRGSTDPFLSSIYFLRYISPYFSIVFINLKISANTVTLISLIFAVAGAFLHSFNSGSMVWYGNLFLFLYNVLDASDGEVARANRLLYNKTSGLAGTYFDALVHYIFTPILFFGIGYAEFSASGNVFSLWMGLIAGMWLSAFGQSAAYRTVMDQISAGKPMPEEFSKIWSHDKIDWSKLSGKEFIRAIIREFFSSQGQIYSLIIFSLIDLMQIFPIQIRFVYLYAMALFGIINMIRVNIQFFKILKKC